ncbi:polysaccharide deacetylase family protein, partial [Actinospica acidiphila]|nr:polysaccharide deacetylase family protein [Actinospica acidiphila]
GSWRATLGALPDLVADWRAAGLTVGPLADHGTSDVHATAPRVLGRAGAVRRRALERRSGHG